MKPRTSSARSDRGATAVEYALLLALVAAVTIGALTTLGRNSSDQFDAASEVAGGSESEIVDESPLPPADPPVGGGGGGGGGGDSGTTTTTVPSSTTTTTTTTPPSTTTTTTVPEAEPLSEWTDTGATLENKNKWTSTATVAIHGTDGAPLTTVSAGVEIRVVQIYKTWDGKIEERSWTTSANLSNGIATFTDTSLNTGANGQQEVVAMRYEVTSVAYWWPTNPTITWDGATPKVTVLAPAD